MAGSRQRAVPLVTAPARARGLLGTDADAPAVVLAPCASVHTFGMRYPLDVAFLSPAGEVLRVVRGMGPGRVARCRGARYVVERPHAAGAWLGRGARLALELVDREDEGGA